MIPYIAAVHLSLPHLCSWEGGEVSLVKGFSLPLIFASAPVQPFPWPHSSSQCSLWRENLVPAGTSSTWPGPQEGEDVVGWAVLLSLGQSLPSFTGQALSSLSPRWEQAQGCRLYDALLMSVGRGSGSNLLGDWQVATAPPALDFCLRQLWRKHQPL